MCMCNATFCSFILSITLAYVRSTVYEYLVESAYRVYWLIFFNTITGIMYISTRLVFIFAHNLSLLTFSGRVSNAAGNCWQCASTLCSRLQTASSRSPTSCQTPLPNWTSSGCAPLRSECCSARSCCSSTRWHAATVWDGCRVARRSPGRARRWRSCSRRCTLCSECGCSARRSTRWWGRRRCCCLSASCRGFWRRWRKRFCERAARRAKGSCGCRPMRTRCRRWRRAVNSGRLCCDHSVSCAPIRTRRWFRSSAATHTFSRVSSSCGSASCVSRWSRRSSTSSASRRSQTRSAAEGCSSLCLWFNARRSHISCASCSCSRCRRTRSAAKWTLRTSRLSSLRTFFDGRQTRQTRSPQTLRGPSKTLVVRCILLQTWFALWTVLALMRFNLYYFKLDYRAYIGFYLNSSNPFETLKAIQCSYSISDVFNKLYFDCYWFCLYQGWNIDITELLIFLSFSDYWNWKISTITV